MGDTVTGKVFMYALGLIGLFLLLTHAQATQGIISTAGGFLNTETSRLQGM